MINFFKKYHKWLGIVLTLFILLFSISGIVLNHRGFFSKIDVNRDILPQEYNYTNWNNAAVKGTYKLKNDSILIYGNIGVWLTDSTFSEFSDFNTGFPKGIDNKKICKVFKDSQNNLFAGTLFGLFQFDFKSKLWKKIVLPIHESRIVDITEKDDTLIVMSRSFILKTTDFKEFTKLSLPEPDDYDDKISLFKTFWVIHSGEIYGTIGKLLVDLVGVIFAFLSITGLIYFINNLLIKKRIKKKKDLSKLKKSNKWNLKWHNKIGWITIVFLIITTITGMFLRPPLLIPIANSRVNKIPGTLLDSPNPWFDKLRKIIYDESHNRYVVATLDGIYYFDDNFSSELKRYKSQPPLSVMGVNVFEQINDSNLLVGSFSGLFLWNINSGYIENYITKKPYFKPKRQGSPIGSNVVTGYSNLYNNKEVYFDFGAGAKLINKSGRFTEMPHSIKSQPMSLWNLALEVHTARIYGFIIGGFYILIIPLAGLFILFILISGFVVWYKRHM